MLGSVITEAAPLVPAKGMSRSIAPSAPAIDRLASYAAFAGVGLLAAVAPFERTAPLLELPGQSLSSLEAAVAAALAVWGAMVIATRRLPAITSPITSPWLLFLASVVLAALTAPVARVNALHMAGRFTAAFAIFLLTVNGVRTRRQILAAMTVALAAGVVTAVLAVLEYFRVAAILGWLEAFRPHVITVGAMVRASGPLQYPTIASMYLEVVFALGAGLLLVSVDASRHRHTALVFAALTTIAYAIALTFTRAGLVSLALALAFMAWMRARVSGFDRGVACIGALGLIVAAVFLASRSLDTLWLRFTTEGQDAWYRATVEAPSDVTVAPIAMTTVPVTVTNSGRLAWNSQDPDAPFFLSYHWMEPSGDRFVVFDGARTAFDAPVAPGETVTIDARVRGPRLPGRYRLVWDVVQEHRLWFGSEPGAASTISHAVVAGEAGSTPAPTQAPRPRNVRPGRLVLWRAAARMFREHPLLGVGPDNFRLIYPAYAGLPIGDPRVHSNNMYVEILAGGGLLTGFAFAWLLWSAGRMCAAGVSRGRTFNALATALAGAGLAILAHGLLDSFLGFAPTYVLFAITLGLAAACACGAETRPDAHRV